MTSSSPNEFITELISMRRETDYAELDLIQYETIKMLIFALGDSIKEVLKSYYNLSSISVELASIGAVNNSIGINNYVESNFIYKDSVFTLKKLPNKICYLYYVNMNPEPILINLS